MQMSNFFAMMGRMRLIDRWALMQNAAKENIAEHSHNVAIIAHALCVIGNRKFGKSLDAERCALLALYHDATEVITGDMPTPVKYGSDELKTVYKSVEALAGKRLLDMLPDEFYADYEPLFERHEGDAAAARVKCVEEMKRALDSGKYKRLKKCAKFILRAFEEVPVDLTPKIRVGIVGEIYVKYSPLGNSHLEDFLLSEGCEPVVPALMDFILYCVVNNINDAKFYGLNKKLAVVYKLVYIWLYGKQKKLIRWTKKYSRFEPFHDFEHLRRCADKVINQGVKMGEGWLIPAEMAALAETGTGNIVCAQPFGCLPNHIAGKGAVRALKNLYPDENIVPVDYDPSATRVNQENRIKLMLATARENYGRIKNQEK